MDRKFECKDEEESKPAAAPHDGSDSKRKAPTRRQSAPKKKAHPPIKICSNSFICAATAPLTGEARADSGGKG